MYSIMQSLREVNTDNLEYFMEYSVLYINIQLSSLKFIQLLRCIIYDVKIRFYII
jgi:hypothetical protein